MSKEQLTNDLKSTIEHYTEGLITFEEMLMDIERLIKEYSFYNKNS